MKKFLRPLVLFLLPVLAYACAPADSYDDMQHEPNLPVREIPVQSEGRASASLVSDTLPPSISLKYRGTNLSGGEFGSALPGTFGRDYTYPTNADVDYFYNKGVRFFRIPFMWERLQRSQKAALYPSELAKLDALVTYATGKGMTVALEDHNSARYYGTLVGSSSVPNSSFADFWTKMALQYRSNSRVMFDLTNEPHDMSTEQWVNAANAAIAGIRGTGATNTILVPGNGWDGAWTWNASWYGTPNSTAMLNIKDPLNNVVFEAHQYLDANGSGSGAECVSTTIGSERIRPFTMWLRANGKKGLIGEIGAPNTPTCKAAVTDAIDYMEKNYDVLAGWTWWSAGPWWGSYPLNLSPNNGVESPQLSWVTPYLQCK